MILALASTIRSAHQDLDWKCGQRALVFRVLAVIFCVERDGVEDIGKPCQTHQAAAYGTQTGCVCLFYTCWTAVSVDLSQLAVVMPF